MRILIVVPCGKSKIWDVDQDRGPTRAEEAYTGGPFKVNRAFAKRFADRWVILSAKYGFIDPSFTIPENYNVTFKDPSTNPISLEQLRSQVDEMKLDAYDVVIALGGRDYTSIVKRCFGDKKKVICPAEGLPVGKAMGCISNLTNLDREEMLREIGLC
ncbi:MAG: hypothetical protein QXG63_01290 [Nitrososphaerales archaeon]